MRQCGNTFRDAQRLADHKNVHLGAKPYVCNNCGKVFATSDPLRVHKNKSKGACVPPTPKPFQCDNCVVLVLARRRHCSNIKRRSVKDAKVR
ncbi:hypothetical protein J3F84DRAFT_42746 [Trichoderma pleuroticola]